MKKIFSILICFILFSCSVCAYSYEDAMNDYKKSFDDDSSLHEIQEPKKDDYLTKSSDELYTIPDLSYEEWVILKDRNTKRLEDVSRAVSNPSLSFLDTIGSVPFASHARGASTDKRVAFYDFYNQMYFVIEYNSYYGEILLTPDYSADDGYFFWVNFRLYYNDNNAHNMFARIGSSFYKPGSSVIPELGYNDNGDPIWVFYVYSFSKPTDYNSSAQVSFGNNFGSFSRGQDTTLSLHDKFGQYWYNCRWRLFSYYIDKSNADTTPVIVNHSSVPVCAGLFLYSDDTLRICTYGDGAIKNQTISHDGTITGNITVNGRNIYTNYQSYTVNGYNYWLFANFVDSYDVNIISETDYGIFTGLYNTVFMRLDYVSSYVIPQAKNSVVSFIDDHVQSVNTIIDLYITSSGTSVFWFFTILLGFALLAIVIRFIVYVTRW